jgi:hypothetical protein
MYSIKLISAYFDNLTPVTGVACGVNHKCHTFFALEVQFASGSLRFDLSLYFFVTLIVEGVRGAYSHLSPPFYGIRLLQLHLLVRDYSFIPFQSVL